MSHEGHSQSQGSERLDLVIRVGIVAGILVSIAVLAGVVAIAFPTAGVPVELLPTLVFTAAVAAVVGAVRRVGGRREGRNAD